MTSEIWGDFWEKKNYEPIVQNPPRDTYGGTNTEPLASQGMAHFLDPARPVFKEGVKVLDYGGGAGILGNFISERLQSFEYFCLEPKGAHGASRIQIGENLFKDSRVFFGFIEDDLEFCFTKKPDVIVLISVFTHLEKQDIEEALSKLHKVFEYNPACQIVFSCFLGPSYKRLKPEPHIWTRFYGKVILEESYLKSACIEKGFSVEKCSAFVAQGGHRHEIFKLTRGIE